MKNVFVFFLISLFFLTSCDKGDPIKPGPPEPTPNPPPPVEDTVQFSLKTFVDLHYTRDNWKTYSAKISVCKDSLMNPDFCEWRKIVYAPDGENRIYSDSALFGPFFEDEAEKWIGKKLFVHFSTAFIISPQYSKGRTQWQAIEILEGENELYFEFTSPP